MVEIADNQQPGISRRGMLKIGAGGATAAALGGVLEPSRAFAAGTVRWVSPRGTIEVLDDYPYWVAREFGYFGEIETSLEAARSDIPATVNLIDQGQADVGSPSPGVFLRDLAQGIPLVSVFQMGDSNAFDFAFRRGEMPQSVSGLEGKTVLLGSAGWQSICDPMLLAAGVDISKVTYITAGWPTWGAALAAGQGDAALAWAGLRAQWRNRDFDFDYLVGKNFSQLPANSFVIRKSDFNDRALRGLYTDYLRGWVMGLEFGRMNPRAATEIVMKRFPGLGSQLTPAVATEALLQLADVYEGRRDERGIWGYHTESSWRLVLNAERKIRELKSDFDLASTISNDLVPVANDFDPARVESDASRFALSADYRDVDVEGIRAFL